MDKKQQKVIDSVIPEMDAFGKDGNWVELRDALVFCKGDDVRPPLLRFHKSNQFGDRYVIEEKELRKIISERGDSFFQQVLGVIVQMIGVIVAILMIPVGTVLLLSIIAVRAVKGLFGYRFE